MLKENLAYDYVDAIPWDKNPAFAFSNDSQYYLDAFKNIVDRVPIKGSTIKFDSDVWDFNPYFEGINDASYKLIFNDLPHAMIDYCKFFVLYKIMNKTKISTAKLRLGDIKTLVLYISKNTGHDSLYLISTEDIVNEIRRRNISPSGAHNLYESAHQFYEFIKYNYGMDIPVDIDLLDKLGTKEKKVAKQMLEETKVPDIPGALFDSILDIAVTLMRSKDTSYNVRATACELVMLTQLGLRVSDLTALQTDQLLSKRLPQIGQTVHYIHYKSRKPSKPHDKTLEFDIFCNSLCSEAFLVLTKIRGQVPLSKGNKYLYVLQKLRESDTNELPTPTYRFNSLYRDMLRDYLLEVVAKDWPGINKTKIQTRKGSLKGKKKDSQSSKKEMVYLSIPKTEQYRVHLCTALYEHNIPLSYIQKYMGHLSEFMLGYYIRPKDTYQENIEYSERIIREVAGKEDLVPLGGQLGSEMKEGIKKFISDKKLNVMTDIDAVIKEFGDKLIIRGKSGGVCIKTSVVPCAKDARTNEIYCAYNMCPNLFHFYYMADISLTDLRKQEKLYDYLMENGNTKAAQKELNKLKAIAGSRLIPELDEMDKEIQRKSVTDIAEQHPQLIDIIENEVSIRQEVHQWTTKTV